MVSRPPQIRQRTSCRFWAGSGTHCRMDLRSAPCTRNYPLRPYAQPQIPIKVKTTKGTKIILYFLFVPLWFISFLITSIHPMLYFQFDEGIGMPTEERGTPRSGASKTHPKMAPKS